MMNVAISSSVKITKMDSQNKHWFLVMRKVIIGRMRKAGMDVTKNAIQKINYHLWHGKTAYDVACMMMEK